MDEQNKSRQNRMSDFAYQDVNEIDFGFVEGKQTTKVHNHIDTRQSERKALTAAVIAQLQAADKTESLMRAEEIKQTENNALATKDHGLQVEVVGHTRIKETPVQCDAMGRSSIRIVELLKSRNEPLGFYIRQGDGFSRKNGIFISRITLGSVVDVNGLLKIGEEILKVNSVSVEGFILDDVVRLIQIPNRLILTVRSSERSLPPGMLCRGLTTNLFNVEDEQKVRAKTKEKNTPKARTDKHRQYRDYVIEETKNYVKTERQDLIENKPSGESFRQMAQDRNATVDDMIATLRSKETNNNEPRTGGRKTVTTCGVASKRPTEDLVVSPKKDEVSKFISETSKTNPSNITNFDVCSSQISPARPSLQNKNFSDLSKCGSSADVSYITKKHYQEQNKDHPLYGAKNYENSMAQKPPPGPPKPCRKSSTLQPEIGVTLVFDDEPETGSIPVKAFQLEDKESTRQIPGHLTLPAKPSVNSNSGSAGSSPQFRRRLPSLPGQDSPLQAASRVLQNTTEDGRDKTSSCNSNSNQLEPRPRRLLPTPPSSPIMERNNRLSSTESTEPQERDFSVKSSSANNANLLELQIPSGLVSQQSRSAPVSPKSSHSEIPFNQLSDEKSRSGQNFQTIKSFRPRIRSRKSESHYECFLQQQRHSMFLQSYSSRQSSTHNTTWDKSDRTESDPDLSGSKTQDQLGFSSTLSLSSSTTPSSDKLSVSLQSPFRKSRGSSDDLTAKGVARPSLGDHRRISMATLNEKSAFPQIPLTKIETDPGFLVYPDDYHNENLKLSRAVSGMVSFRIIKACNLQFLDKKLLEKKKKLYWAIEVDFERKAFTTWKRSSTKTVHWDELFDVEIQHGREANLSCYTSHTDFSKPVARVTFNFAPFVHCGQSHQVAFRTQPQGVLFVEMEFTEMKSLLKRAQSRKKTGVFGFTLNVISTLEKSNVPLIVRKCVDEIESRGLTAVGIYRISGNARRKKQLRAEFDENSSAVDLSEENCPDVNVIAGILKDYLRELPEPLIPRQMSEALVRAFEDGISDKSFEVKKQLLNSLLRRLPETNRETLVFLLNHLMKVLAQKEQNRMDARNLSVCLGPVLLCPPLNVSDGKDLLDLKVHMKAVELLLDIWQAAGGAS